MSTPTGRIHEMEHHAADWATTRPVVSGTQGVVAAGHPLVSMAGMRMLLAGGNAFDAAVAAGFAAAVVEPTASYTLCGECVALVYDARRRETQALSGQGTAPAPRHDRVLPRPRPRSHPHRAGSDAHLSFTVPGAVDAYLTLLETLGTKTVSEVLAPAVQYAERGFPMYEYMHRLLAIPETRSQFDVYPPGGTAVFYPGGRVPEVGELFVQPALAGTLRKLVEADAQGRGHRQAGIAAARQRFYRGDVAATIGAFSERLGGLLRASDLAGYRARLEPPLRMAFAGREIVAQSRVDAGARAPAGAGHAGHARPARARPQLAALHPRGDRGAQARVRRSRALLRRRRRRPARRAALAGLRARARRAHPSGPGDARGAAAR